MKVLVSIVVLFLVIASTIVESATIAEIVEHDINATHHSIIDEPVQLINESRCDMGVMNDTVEFRKYFSVQNDTSKYIKCVAVGIGAIRSCFPGTGFNDTAKWECISNNTFVDFTKQRNSSISGRSLGNFNGYGVITGVSCSGVGVLDKFAPVVKCICMRNYTGMFCEKRVDTCQDYLSILNNTFCIEKFINQSYAGFKKASESESVVHQFHLSNLTLRFENISTMVNFEELLINLVDELWSEISPEHSYLRDFDYDSLSNLTDKQLGSAVQKLAYYAKSVMKNFETQFMIYHAVIEKLSIYMQKKSVQMRPYAVEFINEWNKNWIKMNKTRPTGVAMENIEDRVLNMTQVICRMKDELNKTVNMSCCLYKCIKDHIINQVTVNDTMSHNSLMKSISTTVQDLEVLTVKNWNMVIDYGFWLLTNKLSNDLTTMRISQPRMAMGKKFWKRSDLVSELAYPVQNFQSTVSWSQMINSKRTKTKSMEVMSWKASGSSTSSSSKF